MTPTAPPARGAAQHTPGPWRVAYNSRRTRLGTRVAGAGGYVAYVITRDAAAANARLIAAAPDLLEALRAIVADYADDIDITRLTHARTAIAKAAGGPAMTARGAGQGCGEAARAAAIALGAKAVSEDPLAWWCLTELLLDRPWERCPSTHCERRGECASPNDCIVKPKEE